MTNLTTLLYPIFIQALEKHSDQKTDYIQSVFHSICQRYSEPHRYYHTLEHIMEMLNMINFFQPTKHLVLSCFFHDLIYDPMSSTNEEDSADHCKQFLHALSFEPTDIEHCVQLILSTKKHVPFNSSIESHIFLDSDLSILGAEPKRYDQYASQIRKEYSHVEGLLYKKERIKILEKFLERKNIYYTAAMQENLEAKARENIQREILSYGEA